jgi:murein tripeptide amidase MpaA
VATGELAGGCDVGWMDPASEHPKYLSRCFGWIAHPEHDAEGFAFAERHMHSIADGDIHPCRDEVAQSTEA